MACRGSAFLRLPLHAIKPCADKSSDAHAPILCVVISRADVFRSSEFSSNVFAMCASSSSQPALYSCPAEVFGTLVYQSPRVTLTGPKS